MTATDVVDIVEVGPRDGYQGIKQFIPTFTKIALLKRLIAAGLKRIEIGSFVSAIALPQLADNPRFLLFATTFLASFRKCWFRTRNMVAWQLIAAPDFSRSCCLCLKATTVATSNGHP